MEEPKFEPPSSLTPHLVVWRFNGLYNVQSFATYDEAAQVYQAVISNARNYKPHDTSFVIYLVYWLAGYSADDH